MPSKSVPEPILLPIEQSNAPVSSKPADLRLPRIDEFLLARSLSPNSQKAYRQDLNHFLRWTQTSWAAVTARQVAQFKGYLLRKDLETGKRVLTDSSVCRILGTLKNFYGWLLKTRYVTEDPTVSVELPKLSEPDAQNLSSEQVEQILIEAIATSLPERNLALVSVLLHGLRASEAVNLNLEDYDGQRLFIRQAKADSKGQVPLAPQTGSRLNAYLTWRQQQGHAIEPTSPLFVSESRRNWGKRLSYDGIRKVVETIEKQTGLSIHTHQFRHTFATNLVLQGMNPYHVMTLTRHRSTASFRRYTKAADQAAAETAFYKTVEPNNSMSI